MKEEKRNRIVAAVTVNTILLILILAAVVVYQLVEIKLVKNTRNNLVNQINYYQEQTENANGTLEYYKSHDGLLDLALKYGYVFK